MTSHNTGAVYFVSVQLAHAPWRHIAIQRPCFLYGPWGVYIRRICCSLISSVKRMGTQRHAAVQLSVGGSHGKFVVEEELEAGLWRLSVWLEDSVTVRLPLVKTGNPSACATVNWKVYKSEKALYLSVSKRTVTKALINPILRTRTRYFRHAYHPTHDNIFPSLPCVLLIPFISYSFGW
jgi:hypothetical protein